MGQAKISRPRPVLGLSHSHSMSASMPREVRRLHMAVMWNQWAVVQELAENGTDVDHAWFDSGSPAVKNGTTPLCEAVSLNHIRVVEVLLLTGAQVNKPDHFGLTPLHKAAFHGRALMVEQLVRAGADIHSLDPEMNTPLHLCLQQCGDHNSSAAVLAFIRAGASINAVNMYGLTPLHYAASWAAHDIVRILIKAQSEIDCTDLHHKTPLYCCISAIMLMNRRLCGDNGPLPVDTTKWKHTMLYKRLPTVQVLLMAGCDSLNLATWFRENYSSDARCIEMDFYSAWFIGAVPERLKHLCRLAILKHLGSSPDFDTLCRLPLPKTLVNYLSRKLF